MFLRNKVIIEFLQHFDLSWKKINFFAATKDGRYSIWVLLTL